MLKAPIAGFLIIGFALISSPLAFSQSIGGATGTGSEMGASTGGGSAGTNPGLTATPVPLGPPPRRFTPGVAPSAPDPSNPPAPSRSSSGAPPAPERGLAARV